MAQTGTQGGASYSAAATSASGLGGPVPTAKPHKPKPANATITMQIKGAKHHDVRVGQRLRAIGRIRPFVPNQNVVLKIGRKGHRVKVKSFAVTQIGHSNAGRFHIKSGPLLKPGPYRISAVHAQTKLLGRGFKVSKPFGVSYPDLGPGSHGNIVRLFSRLLSKDGYYTPHGGSYGEGIGLAVLAFRKVNGMSRITDATPAIFRKVAAGKGGFKLKYPNAGKHVEVDISRQVMALAEHGKAQYIFHVSTGAPATPTITGHYSVYSKTPGRLPDGMYYSSFWHGGYAIHGYPSVPTYNASHGCVRLPNRDAIFVYDWLPIGTDVYTYY